ncbi:hypothetical protein ACHAXM_000467 [Skeletonema potamos]
MKFCNLALSAALLAPKVNSQNVTNGNFTFLGSYQVPTDLGRELGGGSIVGNKLLIVVWSAYSDESKIASVPILRNETTGRIIGFNFTNASDIYVHPKLDQMSQAAKFVGDQYIVTGYDNKIYFANQNFTAISNITKILGLKLMDQTGTQFKGCYGVDFSPVIMDPGTGTSKVMCASYYSYYDPPIGQSLASFMELGLQPKTNGAANEWEFTNVTKLAQLDVEYPGGFSFIPSGSYKGNIFYASWDDEIIKMMEFDASGRPAGNISHPVITNFITGIEGPWGFFFDPQTNDFFVSTWDYRCADGIVHFGGFVPGLDVEVVVANIKNEMMLALSILLDSRRKLRHRISTDQSKNGGLWNQGANPCDKANPNAAGGLGKKCSFPSASPSASASPSLKPSASPSASASPSSKPSTSPNASPSVKPSEWKIPSADEIVDELLNLGAEEATETFVDYFDKIFTSDSFNDVLSGEESPEFEENMNELSVAVELLQNAANSALDIGEDKRAEVLAALAKVDELLELLANVGEGKGL